MAFANVKVVALMLRLYTRWVVALTLLRTRWVVALTLLRTRWVVALTLLRTCWVVALTLLRTRRVVASMRLDTLSPTMTISLTVLSLCGGGKRQRGKGNPDRTRQTCTHVESPGKGLRSLSTPTSAVHDAGLNQGLCKHLYGNDFCNQPRLRPAVTVGNPARWRPRKRDENRKRIIHPDILTHTLRPCISTAS